MSGQIVVMPNEDLALKKFIDAHNRKVPTKSSASR